MKRKALFSLFLLVPAPSVGVLFGMVWFPGTALGQGVFLAAKVWILLLPAVWHFAVERGAPGRGAARPGGLRAGAWSGLAIGAVIVAAAFILGPRFIDVRAFRAAMAEVGLGSPAAY